MAKPVPECFDYVIVGSGFGGSVSALRLTEKGYRVLVLERGKRFRDQDFARSTWNVFVYMVPVAFGTVTSRCLRAARRGGGGGLGAA
jgi:choline dehydrogenase-like flavoprotein